MLARAHIERPAAAASRPVSTPSTLVRSVARPACNSSACCASSGAASCSTSSPIAAARMQHQAPRRDSVIRAATAAADQATASAASDDIEFSTAASEIVQYALNFALVAETYEAHSWMLLLGMLKNERCRAAQILQHLGLTDLYGAWNEVLWALNASSGLEPRAYSPSVKFADRASRIITGSQNFAAWAGRSKVQSEDILMALAAGQVLQGLFPDLGLTFENVRLAVAKAGCTYKLPEEGEQEVQVVQPDDIDIL